MIPSLVTLHGSLEKVGESCQLACRACGKEQNAPSMLDAPPELGFNALPHCNSSCA